MLEGFRAVFRQPAVGLAEIAWRWSFGAAAMLLATLGFLEYLDTLPVSRSQLFLLHSRQPFLISHAIGQIFRGSAPRLVAAAIVVAVALGVVWIVIASFGRATTLRVLLEHSQCSEQDSVNARGKSESTLSSLMGLNFLRVAVFLAAVVAGVGAVVLAGIVSPSDDPSPGVAFLVFVVVVAMVGLTWSVANWLLSLAAIFVVRDGQDAFGAVTAAADLCLARPGPVFSIGAWFGLAHGGAFLLATAIVAMTLMFASLLPGRLVLTAVVLITLVYFLVADFLYVGRLAAYVSMIEGIDSMASGGNGDGPTLPRFLPMNLRRKPGLMPMN